MIAYKAIMPMNPQTKPNQNIWYSFPFKVGMHILHTFEQCNALDSLNLNLKRFGGVDVIFGGNLQRLDDFCPADIRHQPSQCP